MAITVCPPGPSAGDWAFNFTLPSHTGPPIGLADEIGKPLVVVIYLQDGSADCAAELCGFRDAAEQFRNLDAHIIALGVDPLDSHRQFAATLGLPFPLLHDENGAIAARYGAMQIDDVEGRPTAALVRRTFLLGPDRRILKVYRPTDLASHAAEVLADVKAIFSRETPRQMLQCAPVLLSPNVLDGDFCARLIEVWETQGNEDSGFMKQVDGKTVGVYDSAHKIRRDHFLKPGPEMQRLKELLSNRLLPEMKKAFNFTVSRFEDFRIACYDADRGGYFRPHRDNTTPATAHRRFAVSLLLNDDYEGGCLRFPEYGPHLYRPATGGAAVFSCSLLHEATNVTAGRRFVLLTFLYGEEDARKREEYLRRSGAS